jgi:Ubiquitin family
VNPDTEIQTVKEILVQKVAFLQEAQKEKPTCGSSNNYAFLAVFWLASAVAYLQQNKLRSSDLSFMYNGKPLDNDCCLADYRVRENAVVQVSLRLAGGCFMVSATVFCMLCTAVIGSTCTCGLSLIAVPFLLPLLFVLPLFCL